MMLSFERARAEQYDEFMRLMIDESAEYSQETMELMQMSKEQFDHLFRTVGEVRGIYEDGNLAGFYWIEERGKVLHLHGLILKPQFQNRGIGTQVLKMLASKYKGSLDAIELGVHESNERGKTLYERLGFKTIKRLDDLRFCIMQKALQIDGG